jgi:hypothetical protein
MKQNFILKALLGAMVLFCFIALLLPAYNPPGKLMAKLRHARKETTGIASGLKEYAIKVGGISNVDAELLQNVFFGTNSHFIYGTNISGQMTKLWRIPANQTNAQGQILDLWGIPYQIGINAGTNFIIHSAGPDKKFGSKDDIVFDSALNNFVKP